LEIEGIPTDFFTWATSFSPDVCLENKTVIFGNKLKVHFLALGQCPHFEGKLGEKEIVLWEDIWHNRREQVKARITSLVGKNKRINARDTHVVALDKPAADAFLEQNHLMGAAKVKHKFGLVYKGMTVAVATLSAPRKYYRGNDTFNSIELVRYASLKGVNVVGGMGKLLEHAIATLKPDDIMTYADREWSAGEVYEKMGFEMVETTPPITFWVHPVQLIRFQSHQLPLTLLSEQLLSDLTLNDFMLSKGYNQLFNMGNNKFLLKLK